MMRKMLLPLIRVDSRILDESGAESIYTLAILCSDFIFSAAVYMTGGGH